MAQTMKCTIFSPSFFILLYFQLFSCSASSKDKQVIPLVACDLLYVLGSTDRVVGWRHTFTTGAHAGPIALTGHVVHRSRASDGTAAPHWEITQRWDLMALRLSGSQKPTSDPQPWPLVTPPILQGPVFAIGHLSNPSHWSDYGPIWNCRLHTSRIKTSSFQQLYMTTKRWIVAGRVKGQVCVLFSQESWTKL